MRKFNLRLSRGSLRAFGENIQDKARTVKDFHLQLLFDVGNLLGRKVVVENHHPYIVLFHIFPQFGKLALPHECARVRIFEFLGETAHNLGTGSVGQEFQFVKIFAHLCLILPLGNQPDEHGALIDFFSYY